MNGGPATPRAVRLDRYAPVAIQLATAVVLFVGWLRFPSPYSEHLGKLMQLEFLALHAGAFLGIPILLAPATHVRRALRALWLLAFAALYAYAGHSVLGWLGVLEIAMMIFATYAGVILSRGATRRSRATETGARWLIALLLFMLLGGALDAPSSVDSWHQARIVPLFGALYFAGLAALEASGAYRLLRGLFDVEHPRNAR